MKVRDIMETQVVTVSVGASYEEVARLLCKIGKSGMPVVDEKGALVGLVSEKDLFRILFPLYQSYYAQPEMYADSEAREGKIEEVRNHLVTRFMSKPVITITSDAPVMRAGAIMLAKGLGRLPVVDNGKLVGIVGRREIYREILKSHIA